MEAKRNKRLANLTSSISKGINITNSNFVCLSNLVRICAIEDTYIKTSKFNNEGDGIFLPAGTIEYFEVEGGEVLNFIGSCNVSSIF